MAGPKRAHVQAGQRTTPTKKIRVGQQSALTWFFTSPSSQSHAKGKQRQVGESPERGVAATTQDGQSGRSQEEADAQFAASLAAEDAGSSTDEFRQRLQKDEELAQKLHHEWSLDASAEASGSRRVPFAVARPEPPSPSKALSVSRHVDLAAMDASIESIRLADDVFAFDPSQVDTSSWPTVTQSDGCQVPTTPYALLTYAFVQISATRSRLAITTYLTNLLRVVRAHDPASLLATVYLVSNHIAPPYDGVELGLGGSVINKAIQSVTGKSARFLRQVWDRTGDAGDVAFEAKKDVKALVRPAPITVQRLYANLHSIARLGGQGSSSQKLGYVTKLLVASRGEETRFLVRTFISHLRIQAVRTTIATALARTFALIEEGDAALSDAQPTEKHKELAALLLIRPEERKGLVANAIKPKDRQDPRRLGLMERLGRAEKLVRQVRARHPNFGVIVPALLSHGLPGLSHHVPLAIGTPISPMLGSITRSLAAMHVKLGPRTFVSEFKYDGQRCQIHAVYVPRSAGPEARKSVMDDSTHAKRGKWVGKHSEIYVRLFSRHLEEMTEKYPDITDMVPILMGRETEEEGSFHQNGLASLEPEAKSRNMVVAEREAITSFIMDAEVVAMGMDERLLPFQTLANRSRKEVNLHEIKVKVGVFAFDLMYLNGESLLTSSFRVRRRLLRTRFQALVPQSALIARFAHVRSCESTRPDDVARFFALAQQHKCEGIMVKSLDHHWEAAPPGPQPQPERQRQDDADSETDDYDADTDGRLEQLADVVDDDLAMNDELARGAPTDEASTGKGVNGRGKALLSTYEPDKRCESWLKVKKDYVDGLGDSLDVVPIGAWHGMGRKATWWSPILLALYEPDTGVLQAVCKCISGFTDAFYKELNVRYREGSATCLSARHGDGLTSSPWGIELDTGNLWPDVWWKPSEVWEIRGADVTLSPNYTAALGLVSDERGLSIRFPRFLRRRDDKCLEQATTPAQLAQIYWQQQNVAPPDHAASAAQHSIRGVQPAPHAEQPDVAPIDEDDVDEDDVDEI